PEEQQDHLPPEILKPHGAPVGRRKRERRRDFGRLVLLDLQAREVGAGGPGAADGQQRQGQQDNGAATGHEAVDALTVFRTSSGSRRSSGLSITFMHLTVPVLSMMK